MAADECLTAAGRKQGAGFRAICLRPGTLTDGEGEGKVALGKTSARGEVNRKDVARVIVALLEGGYAGGWLDLLNGEEAVSDAVERCEKEAVNCVEGEDTEEMVRNS